MKDTNIPNLGVSDLLMAVNETAGDHLWCWLTKKRVSWGVERI